MSDSESLNSENSHELEEWEVVNNVLTSDSEQCEEENAIDNFQLVSRDNLEWQVGNENGYETVIQKRQCEITVPNNVEDSNSVESNPTGSTISGASVLLRDQEVRFIVGDDSDEVVNDPSNFNEIVAYEDSTLEVFQIWQTLAPYRYIIFSACLTLIVAILMVTGSDRTHKGIDILMEPPSYDPLFECKTRLHDKLRKLADCRTSSEFCYSNEKPSCYSDLPHFSHNFDDTYKKLFHETMFDSKRIANEKDVLQQELKMLQKNLTSLLVTYNELKVANMFESDWLRRTNAFLTEQLHNKSLEADENCQQKLATTLGAKTTFESYSNRPTSNDENDEHDDNFGARSKFESYSTHTSETSRFDWHSLFDNMTRQFVERLKPVEKMENLARATTSFLNQSLHNLNQFYDALQNLSSLHSAKKSFENLWNDSAVKLSCAFKPNLSVKCNTIDKRVVMITAMTKVLQENENDQYCKHEELDFFADLSQQLINQLTPSQQSLDYIGRMTVAIVDESINGLQDAYKSLHQAVEIYAENATILHRMNDEFFDFWKEENVDKQDDIFPPIDDGTLPVTVESDKQQTREESLINGGNPVLQSPASSEITDSDHFVVVDDTQYPNRHVKMFRSALKRSNIFYVLDRFDADYYLNTLKNFAKLQTYSVQNLIWWQCQMIWWGVDQNVPSTCHQGLLPWQQDDELMVNFNQYGRRQITYLDDSVKWQVKEDNVELQKLVEMILSTLQQQRGNTKDGDDATVKKSFWLLGRWEARKMMRKQETPDEEEEQWMLNRSLMG